MAQNNLPLACKLTDAAFQRRRHEVLNTIQSAVLETRELADGYAYRFPAEAAWIDDLSKFITFERACCPFLRFALRLEPENGPLWLEMTGPEGTKDFLRSVLDSD
jgi:hypothetical protein